VHHQDISCVWNPRKGSIKDLKRVQMRETNLVSGLKKKCYKEGRMELKLKYRRIRGDLIEVYKLAASQLVIRSTRHAVDSSQTGGQLVTACGQFVTSKSKQTSKPY